MDIIKFSYTEVLKDGVCMSIEMWFINNSNNTLLQEFAGLGLAKSI